MRKIIAAPSSAVAAVIAIILSLSVMMPRTALASLPSGPPGPNQAAATNGTPNFYNIDAVNYGSVGHVCSSIGQPYKGVSAIMCADIYTLPVQGTHNVQVYLGTEGYCQAMGDLPECTEVEAYFIPYADGNSKGVVAALCGVHDAQGPCNTNARNYFYYYWFTLNNDGDCHNFQTQINPDYGLDDISLPGPHQVDLTSTITTATVHICDEML